MNAPFFTIGHSTRPLAEFIGLLKESEIDMLVDVRSIPRSRTNPQFNQDTLPASLSAEGVAYVHSAALGGRRGKRNTDQPSPNTYWTHPAFRNYADYALGDPFRAGSGRTAGPRPRAALRDHVLGSRVVAMSSADCGGLSARARRDRAAHHGPASGQARDAYAASSCRSQTAP